jgi:hypothetical protein
MNSETKSAALPREMVGGTEKRIGNVTNIV